MNRARHYTLACVSIAVLAACGKSEVTSPEQGRARLSATESLPTADETTSAPIEATSYPRLGEEIVDPDVDEPLTSDEDAADDADAEPADNVVLADTKGEVTFRTLETSSLRASDAQAGFAENAERHNREARQQTSLPGSESTATMSAAPASADTAIVAETSPVASTTPTGQNDKPAAQTVDEKKILSDPQGQWASTASASSTYAQTTGEKAGYAAWQATGTPNVPRYADHPAAWTAKSGDSKAPEWLELGFAKPVHATSLRIRQTAAPGAVAKIELIDKEGAAHEIWTGTDDTPYQKDAIGWLVKDFPRTSFVVKGARITLLTARVWGWNEIDAVQLVGEP